MSRVEEILKEFEDYLAPLLGLKPGERAVYMHALRHSRLEGRRGVVFSGRELAQGVGLKESAARLHLFALARKGCVRVKRYRRKNAVEVLLPEEVARDLGPRNLTRIWRTTVRPSKNPDLCAAILRRERRRCFYCRKFLRKGDLWFDHIVPLARGGWPAADNVVACCQRCNRMKSTRSPEYLLNRLRQSGVLSRAQVRERKRALKVILAQKGLPAAD
jgi:5-methylcytosine-specific restriction endonuclease McrA